MPEIKLSVVIVVYDMPRQIVRTMQSLSPQMQRGVSAEDYELVVVDNGSSEPIDRAQCEQGGATIRWLTVVDPTPSPGPAVNLGLAAAGGPLVGVLVDGARLASPGLLRHALVAARVADRPVISTLSYHLGREPQYLAAAKGYDEAQEERLLAHSGWEADGYRLFDIAVPGGASRNGMFRSPFETNGLFMPAALWEELGGYDERFASAGGGLVNLDVFKRACALPDIELVSLLGEATFHQAHGGVSTNHEISPQAEWQAEYERLRGARFRVPDFPMLSLGSPAPPAVASIHREGATAELVRRYVELLKSALLNETGLEAEAAFFLACDALETGRRFDGRIASDVRDSQPEYVSELAEARADGRLFREDRRRIGFAYSMIGRRRLDELDGCVSAVLDDGVAGDLVECGCGAAERRS